ncbi:MAG: protein kinase, partial [Bacteroidota bacterium]|nr:protein kinase [Bacteroidota bacterium]
IDLGLSRTTEKDKNKVLKFGGVDYYMPPERINISSAKKYTTEPDLYSDVYQIGLLIYLVLYNDLPFGGFIWEELAQSIKEDAVVYPELSFLNYPVSRELITLMEKCLRKNPEERYPSATEILEDFRKFMLLEKQPLT